MGKQTSKLTPGDMPELIEQTAYTEAELQTWYKDFLEDYPSGVLSLQDFKTLYSDLFPDGDAAGFANHAFRQFDLDGNGRIDFREFITALSVSSKGTLEEKLYRAFLLYDVDCNGFITRDEMTEIVTAINKMVGDELLHVDLEKSVSEIFEIMDQDHDGRLSAVEFVEGSKNDPDLMRLVQCGWQSHSII